MKKILACSLMFLSYVLNAQSIQNYAVTYEKKVNLANLYKNVGWFQSDDKFYKEEYLLTTNSDYSMYQKIESTEIQENYLSSYMTYSETYIDLMKKTQISQKEVGEKTFLMKDSLPEIQWHIHNETKEIAGYTCTKAMAKFADSIVIVAYYTEDLEASIGPESVGGLPGTILGLVIPKLHTTWLAKSVEKMEVNPPKNITAPTKGQPTDKKKLFDLVKETYKDHPKVNSIVWRVIL